MNCKHCGLPKFYGAMGYVGTQCACIIPPTTNTNEYLLNSLEAENKKLKEENENLKRGILLG
jgi:hypothetical protein